MINSKQKPHERIRAVAGNNKIKKLYLTRFILTILQIVSIVLLIFCMILIRSNIKFIADAKFYVPEVMVVDSLHCTGGRSPENCSRFAEGIIKNEKKIVLLKLNSNYRKYTTKKDTLFVWNKKGDRQAITRSVKENNFPIQKYKESNIKVIFFGVLPIILLWVYRYSISKKIKNLKTKLNES